MGNKDEDAYVGMPVRFVTVDELVDDGWATRDSIEFYAESPYPDMDGGIVAVIMHEKGMSRRTVAYISNGINTNFGPFDIRLLRPTGDVSKFQYETDELTSFLNEFAYRGVGNAV